MACGAAGCGFAPAEGPGAPGAALRGSVLVDAPDSRDGFDFVAVLEDRLGRPAVPRYRLAWRVTTETIPGGITATGATTRFTLTGRATYRLTEGERVLAEGAVESFTGWFDTATTVAAAAAEADARRRLMAMLADRVVARLYAALA